MSAAEPGGRSRRFHSLDNVRAILTVWLVLGHGMLPYATFREGFVDPDQSTVFDALFIYGYCLLVPSYLVLAGFFVGDLRHRVGWRDVLRNRVGRMLVPLLAIFPVIPPLTHVAVVFAKGASRTGTLVGGWEKLERTRLFRVDIAYHLWFLLVMLLFCAIAVPVHAKWQARAPDSLERVRRAARLALSGPAAPLALFGALAVPLAAIELVSVPALQYVLSLAVCFVFYGLGWALRSDEGLLDSLAKHAEGWIALSIVLAYVAVPATRDAVTGTDARLAVGPTAAAALGLMTSFGVLGFLGAVHRGLARPVGAMRFVSDASFWVYVTHLPLVVAFGGLLSVTDVPLALKPILSVGGTLAVTLSSFVLLRGTGLGRFLGLPRCRRG